MDKVYLVEWSGGYEAPSHKAFATKEDAMAQAVEWASDMNEDEGDTVDVLCIDLTNMTTTRVEADDMDEVERTP